MLRHFREPVNGFSHLAGAVLGLVGLVWLIHAVQGDVPKLISVTIYGLSLVLLYSSSAALHLIYASPRWHLWLRRFDHAAIYLLIAGTYTPIVYNVLSGTWRWGVLGIVWALAVFGVIWKLFFLRKDGILSVLFYVGMGWVGIITVPVALNLMSPLVIALILGGGIAYSVGAVVFARQRPNLHPHFGHHELWHMFCLLGSVLHFAAIWLIVT